MRGYPLWISPIDNAVGFFRRYLIVSVAVALLSALAAFIVDQSDRFYFSSLLEPSKGLRLCNVSIAGRLTFIVLAAMEFTTVAALAIAALRRRLPGEMQRGSLLSTILNIGARKIVLLSVFLAILHLMPYAIAFHSDDICLSNQINIRLRHYALLVSSSVLYWFGSILLIGAAMLGLRRYLLTAPGEP